MEHVAEIHTVAGQVIEVPYEVCIHVGEYIKFANKNEDIVGIFHMRSISGVTFR